jgi:hypothetical protein
VIPGLGIRRDVAAPAVHGDDLPVLAQQRDSAPYRDAGDAILNGELGFTGQPGVGSESPGIDVCVRRERPYADLGRIA